MKQLALALLALSLPAWGACGAATRFWVGGGSANTWAATGNTNWATTSGGAGNAAVPGSGDDVCFDGNSGSGNSVIAANITINSLDTTGYTGTITHNAAVNLSINLSMTLNAGMAYTAGSNASTQIIFIGSTAGQTITSAGKTLANITINGTGDWTLQDAMTISNASTFGHTKGGFSTNNQAFSVGVYSSSNINTRSLTLGTSAVSLTGIGTVWATGGITGLTLSAASSSISITNTGASGKTFASSTTTGLTFGNMTVTGGGAGSVTFSGTSTFATMTLGHPKSIVLPGGITTTVTTLSAIGTAGNVITVTSSTGSATISQASGTICGDYLSLTNIVGSGGANFYAGPLAHSTDGGGNTGWTFTACPVGGANIRHRTSSF